uniref:DUF148 domain-containing protein n=1 Tax=Rhabditophanes sp. KR3021 TaxID=114890 RepID=A0AC35UEI3_9BILA
MKVFNTIFILLTFSVLYLVAVPQNTDKIRKSPSHHKRIHLPPFIQRQATVAAQKEYSKIFENKALIKQEVHDAELLWSSKQPQNIQDAFKKFELSRAKKAAKDQNKFERAAISEEAKLLHSKIHSIKSDMTITHQEEHQQIKRLMANASPSVKKELLNTKNHHKKRRPHPKKKVTTTVAPEDASAHEQVLKAGADDATKHLL